MNAVSCPWGNSSRHGWLGSIRCAKKVCWSVSFLNGHDHVFSLPVSVLALCVSPQVPLDQVL